MKTVYEYDFGNETYGEVRLNENNKYQCYETPQFGGEFMKVGKEFENLENAISFLKSLT